MAHDNQTPKRLFGFPSLQNLWWQWFQRNTEGKFFLTFVIVVFSLSMWPLHSYLIYVTLISWSDIFLFYSQNVYKSRKACVAIELIAWIYLLWSLVCTVYCYVGFYIQRNLPVVWQLEPTEVFLSFFKSLSFGSNKAYTLHINVILGALVWIWTQSTNQELNRKNPPNIFSLTVQLPIWGSRTSYIYTF